MNIIGETIQNGEPSPEHPVEIENKTNLTGAIEILNKLKSNVTLIKADEKEYRLPFLMDIEKQAIETVLSELEKKEAIINEMVKWLYEDDTSFGYGNLKSVNTPEKIKQYFTKKVEGK